MPGLSRIQAGPGVVAVSILTVWNQVINAPLLAPLLEWQGLRILPGLNAITGDEGTGKTRLLRALAQASPDALWLDLRLPEHDQQTPEAVWSGLQARCPHWNAALQADLAEALQLNDHLGKRLNMLSTGSRRKVGLVGLMASGVRFTCIDQPCVALDAPSVRVIRGFLQDMADHPSRAWLIADYEADPQLAWASTTELFRQ